MSIGRNQAQTEGGRTEIKRIGQKGTRREGGTKKIGHNHRKTYTTDRC